MMTGTSTDKITCAPLDSTLGKAARDCGRLQGLDGLRGIGALMVVFYHLSENHLFPAFGIVASGHLFVLVFFVISGVVISLSAENMPSFSTPAFMWRRFARIWPLHAAILCAMLSFHLLLWRLSGLSVGAYFIGDHSLPSFVASLLLLQSMGIYEDVVWNGPSWSISVEFYTYVLYAFVMSFLGRRAWVGYISIVIISLGIIAANGGLIGLPYMLRFFYCTFGFFTGALLFRYVADRDLQRRGPRTEFLRQLIIVTVLLVSLQFYKQAPALILLFLPAMVIVIHDLARDRGFLPGLLSTSPMRFLGKVSYAVYLSHIPLLNVFTRLESVIIGRLGLSPDLASILFLPTYFTMLIALSWIIYQGVEIPAQKWLTRAYLRNRPVSQISET